MKSAKLLVIDDAEDICLLLSILLRRIGISTESVHSLSDASIALQNNHYPIIFLDNHLPDGLGIDFIECIKKDSPASKIIMLTAHDDEQIKLKALKSGAHFFIGTS